MDPNFVLLGFGPQLNLSQNLVGKWVAHDERRVSVGTSQVDQTTLGQKNDVPSILQCVALNLRLDDDLLDRVGVQPLDVDLVVEVADVADDGVVVHLFEVLGANDSFAAGGGDEDASLGGGLVHGGHFESFHRRLEGVDRIDFGDDDARAEGFEGVGTAFADIAVAANNWDFAGQHDVCSALDTVDQRFSATV